MLQQHFNNNTFKLEEKIYAAEGIEFSHISFVDNQPMIELITERNEGILPLLDEELKVPGGSDANFLAKLGERQLTNPRFKNSVKNPSCFETMDLKRLLRPNCQVKTVRISIL